MRFTLGLALLMCSYVSAAIAGQTPQQNTSHGETSPDLRSQHPVIKCDEPASSLACNSFKQLVNTRDRDLLDIVYGSEATRESRISYVCFRPEEDTFVVVEFNRPKSSRYYHAPSLAVKLSLAFGAFGLEDKPPVSESTRQLWMDSLDENHSYAAGDAALYLYQNGIATALVRDGGTWSTFGTCSPGSTPCDGARYEGGYFWIEQFNKENENKLAADDKPEHGHISIDGSRLYVHYSYDNKNNTTTDYSLVIQSSTGRFTETFDESNGKQSEDSATCKIFE